MVSKAIASLDEWLVRAEDVLREQNEQALSPSSSGAWEDVKHEWTMSLGSLELGLIALLDRLCCRPGRWVLIAEDARRSYRFWQALAFEDGSLVVEAASGFGSPDSSDSRPKRRITWSRSDGMHPTLATASRPGGTQRLPLAPPSGSGPCVSTRSAHGSRSTAAILEIGPPPTRRRCSSTKGSRGRRAWSAPGSPATRARTGSGLRPIATRRITVTPTRRSQSCRLR
jgi:hypothetical protein